MMRAQSCDERDHEHLDREAAGIVANMPQVARFADGRPISSKEVVVIINLKSWAAKASAMSRCAASKKPAFQLGRRCAYRDGRMFRWGAREIIVGAGITKRFVGAQIGRAG